MRQQGAFAAGADTFDIIQWCRRHRLCTFGAVGAYGKSVRFVPQTLDEIQNRIVHPKGEWARSGAVEFFFAGIAINAFCNTDKGHIENAKLVHDLAHS